MDDDIPKARGPLEVLGTAAALTALLLPAAGVLMRWIAFALGGVQPSFDSALAASGTELALSGFSAIISWPIIAGLAIQVGVLWLWGLKGGQAPTWNDFKKSRQRDPLFFWNNHVLIPLGGIIGSATTLGIGFAIAFAGTYVAGFAARWGLSDKGKMTLPGAILAVVVALAFAATGTAVAGDIPGLTPVKVHFDPKSGLPDGSYVTVGHDGDLYLWSCAKDKLEEINSDVIIDVIPSRALHEAQPTGPPLGAHPRCP
jgi:hypothetical protein